MSEIQKNLVSRRSIYKFSKEKVDEKFLDAAFEAARNAPNHKNTHPWKYYIIGEKTRDKLIPKVRELSIEKSKKSSNQDIEKGIQRAISKIINPPILIAVTSALKPEDKFREEEDYAATVCSLHNFVLSLWGNGIGAQWSTGKITRSKETYAALKIPTKSERIIGFLKVGYPEKIPTINKKETDEIRVILP